FWSARAQWLIPAARTEAEVRRAIWEAARRGEDEGGPLVEAVGRLAAPWSPSGSLCRTRLDVESALVDGRRLDIDAPVALVVAGLTDPSPAAEVGDRVRVTGTLRLPEAGGSRRAPFDLPAQPHLLLKSAQQIEILSSPSGLIAPVHAARAAMKRRLRANLAGAPEDDRTALGLLLAFVLGDTQDLPLAAVGAFRDGGVAHIVAISGLQVALVAAFLGFLVRKAGVSPRARDAIVLVATLLFAVFAGGRPPVWRAALMIGLYLAARLLGRPTSPEHVLGFSASVILLADPSSLFDVGFLLTFAAVFGLAEFGAPLVSWLRDAGLPAPVADTLGATLGAELAVLPVQAHVFNVVPYVALLSNPFIVPLSGVFLLAGLGLLPFLLVSPGAAAAAIVPLRLLSDLEFGILEALDRLHAVRVVPTPPYALAATAAGLLLVAGLAARRSLRRGALAGALAAVVAIVATPSAAAPPGTFLLRSIDVGQGDCWLLVTPAGRVLVDGGGSPDRAYEFGRLRLVPKLADLGAVALDAVVLTHPHPDHARGLLAVLSSLPVGRVVLPRAAPRNVFLDEFLAAAARRRLVLERLGAGARFEAAGVAFDVLHPPDAPYPRAKENNGSLVLRARAGERTLLLAGDVEGPAERDLVASGADLSADVLKVPHHGSRTSTTPGFLARVAPRVALVGVGRRNRFGHPAPEVLERLAHGRVRVFRTDRDGDVALTFALGRLLPAFPESVARAAP
ncbi:MAG: DNA internalization-related competence protein ComEC/Rec2, partial [Thermoanaerobaculia bacterium]